MFDYKVIHPAGLIDSESGELAAPETEAMTEGDALAYLAWCLAHGIDATLAPVRCITKMSTSTDPTITQCVNEAREGGSTCEQHTLWIR